MCTRFVLISEDRALAESLREILAKLFGREWTLTVGSPHEALSQCDLVLWDFVPGQTCLPIKCLYEQPPRYSFLLHRDDLEGFRELIGSSDPPVLLKPFARAELVVFLDDLCRRWREHQEGSAAHKGVTAKERDELLQRLMLADLKVQEQNRERMNFVIRCIHDFRAPLTTISGYCGLLLEGRLGDVPSEQQAIVERMQHSAYRLSRMVDTMSRLGDQNPRRWLRLETADIRECVDQAIHDVNSFIANKRLSLIVDVEPAPDCLEFDKSQVEQILVNLLDNACKFTPRTGTIEVKGYPFFWERRTNTESSLNPAADRRRYQRQPLNSYRIDIRDSGPGIPLVQLERIFESSAGCFGGQDRSGGGLGLALCKFIIQQHHGSLWAESRATGAVFSFVLPLQPIELPEQVMESANADK